MVDIGAKFLTLDQFSAILFNDEKLSLDKSAMDKVNTSFEFLKKFSSNKLIYGINTGFGPMAQYKVSEENIFQLQYNLIRSHSSGSGKLIARAIGKGVNDRPAQQPYAGLFRRAYR